MPGRESRAAPFARTVGEAAAPRLGPAWAQLSCCTLKVLHCSAASRLMPAAPAICSAPPAGGDRRQRAVRARRPVARRAHAGPSAHDRPGVRDPARGPLLRPHVVRPRGHRQLGGVAARRGCAPVLALPARCSPALHRALLLLGGIACLAVGLPAPPRGTRCGGRMLCDVRLPPLPNPMPTHAQAGCLAARWPPSSTRSTGWSSSAGRTSWCRCAARAGWQAGRQVAAWQCQDAEGGRVAGGGLVVVGGGGGGQAERPL